MRITSQAAFGGQSKSIAEVADVLRHILAHSGYRLVPLDFAFDDTLSVCTGAIVGHRQVTNAYLLTAAMRAGMKLLTLDSSVAALLASDAERAAHIEVLR